MAKYFQTAWFALLVGGIALGFTACMPARQNSQSVDIHPTDPKTLVQNDLAAFATMPSVADSGWASQATAQAFAKIFGGTSGADLRSFIDQRIRYYLSQAEFENAKASSFDRKYDGWSKDPDESKRMKDANAVVRASNIGALLFYVGMINRQPITLYKGNTAIPVDSPRVGIMLIGPGYQESVKTKDGRAIQLPPSYRQAILVHEARHSDCTGGLKDSDLDIARTAKTAREYNENFARHTCAHLHTYCPEGHEFAGLAACDKHPWGAYSVAAVFQSALSQSTQGIERRLLEAGAIDAYSRLITIDKQKMLNGEYGEPDMTSQPMRSE
jgi:hypothetical protein